MGWREIGEKARAHGGSVALGDEPRARNLRMVIPQELQRGEAVSAAAKNRPAGAPSMQARPYGRHEGAEGLLSLELAQS